MFHSRAICPDDVPRSAEPPCLPDAAAVRQSERGAEHAGRADCHFRPSLLRRAPRCSVLLLFTLQAWTLNPVFSGHCPTSPRTCFGGFRVFGGGVGGRRSCPLQNGSRWWDRGRSGGGFLTIVHHLEGAVSHGRPAAAHRCPLSLVSADGLCARVGGPAVPHVLAAHLHSRAPPAPAGLLLVSRPQPPPAGARPSREAR